MVLSDFLSRLKHNDSDPHEIWKGWYPSFLKKILFWNQKNRDW